MVVQLLSCIQLLATLWTAALQASLSFTISLSLLKLKFIFSYITPMPGSLASRWEVVQGMRWFSDAPPEISTCSHGEGTRCCFPIPGLLFFTVSWLGSSSISCWCCDACKWILKNVHLFLVNHNRRVSVTLSVSTGSGISQNCFLFIKWFLFF